MKNKNAFTLIELLVVIAIIALLLAIIAPSLKKAKEYAKKTICQSHLKQWSIIYQMYLNDSDETYPASCQDPDIDPYGMGTWFLVMKPYYDDPKILECPASISAPEPLPGYLNNRWKWRSQWWSSQFPSSFGTEENIQIEASFGQNWWLTSSDSEWTIYPDINKFKKRSNIASSSTVPVIGDCGAFLVRPLEDAVPPDQDGDYGWVSGDEMRRICTNRHNTGGVNWVFADGSLEHIGLKRLWKIKWHANWVPPTIMDWPDWMKNFPEE